MNESGVQVIPQQQQHYHELSSQVNSMSLDSQGNSARSDLSGQSDKQLTSPTSPVEVTPPSPAEIAAQRRHPQQVYYHSEQVQQAGQYHQSIPGYAPPVQYIQQSIPAGYQNYQDQNVQLANNSQQQQATTPSNMQPPPSPTTPGILSQHYPTPNIPSPQTALIQPSPEQYMASVSAQLSGQRPRYPGAMVYPRGSTNQIYVPVAQPQQLAMYLSGGQYVNGQKNYDFYRTNRISNSAVDTTADFRKMDSQYQQQYAALQQQNLSLAQQQQQQQRPLMQLMGNQQAYYHMPGAPKR